MDWIAEIEKCEIELLYKAADCEDEVEANKLTLVADVLALAIREALADRV